MLSVIGCTVHPPKPPNLRETDMKYAQLAVALGAALMVATAQAEMIIVTTATEIRDASGLVQLIGANDDCRYIGAIDKKAKAIRVDRKACRTYNGGLMQERYTGKVTFGRLPIPADAHLKLVRVCENPDGNHWGEPLEYACTYDNTRKPAQGVKAKGEQSMHEEPLSPAYIRVRNELAVDGYDAPMRNPQEIRSTLNELKTQAEALARRHRELLSELDDADQEAWPTN